MCRTTDFPPYGDSSSEDYEAKQDARKAMARTQCGVCGGTFDGTPSGRKRHDRTARHQDKSATALAQTIADRALEETLAAAPDCATCGLPALDHEEMAGACPGERGWYRASAREHDALPVRRVDPMQPAMVRDWTLDYRGTRYRLRVVRLEDERMLATSFGTEPYGRWWTLPADDHEWIAWSYVAEKLQLRDGDQQAWCALILSATGVVVE